MVTNKTMGLTKQRTGIGTQSCPCLSLGIQPGIDREHWLKPGQDKELGEQDQLHSSLASSLPNLGRPW